MLRKIAELSTKCSINKRAKKLGDKLKQIYNTHNSVSLVNNSPEFRFACRNMLRVNRVIHGQKLFKKSDIIKGGILETNSVLTSFGNVKEKEKK